MKKLLSTVMLASLIVNMLTLLFNVQPVEASETIYIRADGSVEGTTQISSLNNITYMFTGNIYDSIVVERDSIILDGQGYLLQGSGSGYGITLSGRNNVTLKNIEINAFIYGVNLWFSSGNTITNNHASVRVFGSDNNNISGNSFVNNGLYIWDSFGNVVVDNLVNGKPLVYLEDCSDLVIEDAGQVLLFNCNRIRVENLSLSNTDSGVYLWNTNDTIITGNNITNIDGDGVTLYVSSNNIVSGNNIINSDDDGVYLKSASNNTISGNILTGNGHNGISLDISANNNTVSSNSITGSFAGIDCNNSSSCNIFNNNIMMNRRGITFHHAASNNNVFNNNITTHELLGIGVFDGSFNNTIYHNNFINNHQFLLYNAGNNTWDNGCEGNFWSDYAGSDSDGDGIGDTPYDMLGDQDNYPLMNPYWNPSDINHDLIVDIFDVVRAAGAYDSTPSDPEWNPHCDIAEAYGIIDIFDIVTIAMSYGKEYVP